MARTQTLRTVESRRAKVAADKKQKEAFQREEMAPDPERPATLSDKQKRQIQSLYERDCDYVARAKRINLERSEMFAAAKSDGFDPAILKRVFVEKRKDPDELATERELSEMYADALAEDAAADSRGVNAPDTEAGR